MWSELIGDVPGAVDQLFTVDKGKEKGKAEIIGWMGKSFGRGVEGVLWTITEREWGNNRT